MGVGCRCSPATDGSAPTFWHSAWLTKQLTRRTLLIPSFLVDRLSYLPIVSLTSNKVLSRHTNNRFWGYFFTHRYFNVFIKNKSPFYLCDAIKERSPVFTYKFTLHFVPMFPCTVLKQNTTCFHQFLTAYYSTGKLHVKVGHDGTNLW